MANYGTIKIQIPTGKDLDKYYVGVSVGCISSKYTPLLLLPVRGSNVLLNPFSWLDKSIGICLRWRCLLLLEINGICVVSYWFIADWMERLVLYVLFGQIFLIIDCMKLYLFSLRVGFLFVFCYCYLFYLFLFYLSVL